MDKDGRLSYDEFKALLDVRRDMMTKELGGAFYEYTDEQVQKRYDFGCSIAESTKGPTLRTFDKWMNMYRFMKEKEEEEKAVATEEKAKAEEAAKETGTIFINPKEYKHPWAIEPNRGSVEFKVMLAKKKGETNDDVDVIKETAKQMSKKNKECKEFIYHLQPVAIDVDLSQKNLQLYFQIGTKKEVIFDIDEDPKVEWHCLSTYPNGFAIEDFL